MSGTASGGGASCSTMADCFLTFGSLRRFGSFGSFGALGALGGFSALTAFSPASFGFRLKRSESLISLCRSTISEGHSEPDRYGKRGVGRASAELLAHGDGDERVADPHADADEAAERGRKALEHGRAARDDHLADAERVRLA